MYWRLLFVSCLFWIDGSTVAVARRRAVQRKSVCTHYILARAHYYHRRLTFDAWWPTCVHCCLAVFSRGVQLQSIVGVCPFF